MPQSLHPDNEPIEPGSTVPRPKASTLERQRMLASMARRLLGETNDGPAVGRFVELEPLGRGATGLVYSAYDPQLERRVALKVLSSRSDDRIEAGLNEARALARVNHPNIVTIHEVGVQDGFAFIAMELVDGETLQRWADDRPRPWKDVFDAIVQAAAGLHAVHDAGLVHRDIKPANIMMGTDGRVRVTDFGLAETDTGPTLPDRPISGTPGYIAPELFQGSVATPASDQYALGVTAWELLTGRQHRPQRGSFDHDASSAQCPRWLTRVIAKSRAPVPTERWPSLEAFSQALVRARRRRWWMALVLGAAGVVVVAALIAAFEDHQRMRTIEACSAEAARALSWTTDRRAKVSSGLSNTELAATDVMVDHVVSRLDAYVQRWHDASIQACMRTRVEGRWSTDLNDRAHWCLADRADTFAVEVERLEMPAPNDVIGAPQAVAALPSVTLCLDETWIVQQGLPKPSQRSAIRQLRRDIARLNALSRHTSAEHALRELEKMLPSVRGLAWTPLELWAEHNRARLLWRDDQRAASETSSRSVYFRAAHLGEWERAARAALDLSLRLHEDPSRLSDAELWNQHAGVAIEHAGITGTSIEAVRRGALSWIAWRQNDLDRARAEAHHALELYQNDPAPGGLGAAESLELIAMVDTESGRFVEARATMQRVVALREAVFGPRHEVVALSIANLANVVEAQGSIQDAKRLYQRVRTLLEQQASPNPTAIARALRSIAACDMQDGNPQAAIAALEEALQLMDQSPDPSQLQTAEVLSDLARARLAAGDDEQAFAAAEDALQRPTAPIPLTAFESRLEAAKVLITSDQCTHARSVIDDIVNAYDTQGMTTESDDVRRWLLAHPCD